MRGASDRQAPASQADNPLPSAEAILDRFAAVTGGEAKYDRVWNETETMTVKVSGTDVAQVVIYRTRSGNLHEFTHGAGVESETGVNGGVAWSRTGDGAPVLETGADRTFALQAAVTLSEWRQFYKSAETVGTESVEDKPCYVLKVVTFAGESHTIWYEKKTGLQLKEVGPFPTGGEGEMTTPEYFEADGFMMPRILQGWKNGVIVFTMVLDEIKFNQPIPDSIFALPPAIERLMKDRLTDK